MQVNPLYVSREITFVSFTDKTESNNFMHNILQSNLRIRGINYFGNKRMKTIQRFLVDIKGTPI